MAHTLKEYSDDMRRMSNIYGELADTYQNMALKEDANEELTNEEQDAYTGKILRLTKEVVAIGEKYS